MSSTARCVRQSAESANWLFSQMKTTGSLHVAARFIPSCTAPWPGGAVAEVRDDRLVGAAQLRGQRRRRRRAGCPAPTIPLQPRMSSERSAMCIEPPSPLQ